MYYPDQTILYDDIYSALYAGVIQKSGSQPYWDSWSYSTTTWNGKKMMRIGYGNYGVRSDGLLINPPYGYNVLWVRVLNTVFESFRLGQVSTAGADYFDMNEIYSGGIRGLNNISPDGAASGIATALHDFRYHTWI